ncbi:hypothetical protein ACJ41O_000882 [Fusarium nematophilum]
MQNDGPENKQVMPYPQEWHGYSSIPYTDQNTSSQFDASLEFMPSSQHPTLATMPAQDMVGDQLQHENPSTEENSMTIRRNSTTRPPSAPTPVKGKRVRTGCLTCRDRHLKCDQALPDCMNCRKRGRECKRGVRLNFLEINLHRPASSVPALKEWAVEFQDESRHVASEYQGGLVRYAPYDLDRDGNDKDEGSKAEEKDTEIGLVTDGLRLSPQQLPGYTPDDVTPRASSVAPLWPHQGEAVKLEGHDTQGDVRSDISNIATPSSSTQSITTPRELVREQLVALRQRPSPHQATIEVSAERPAAPFENPLGTGGDALEPHFHSSPPQQLAMDSADTTGRGILASAEEIYYMQAFAEEVAVWMDLFNKDKHFSRTIPHHALKSTMLLNALLACGVKHLSLVSPESHDKALFYYNTATTQLLRSLQNPDRNTAECATTAIVLNVYEIMSEKPAQRMSHNRGSRALIRECGWDATSTGIGSACFWLNIGTEVLHCLAAKWQTTWDPEEWGMNLDLPSDQDPGEAGNEQVWVHRILYIVAKVTNFRAAMAKPDMAPRDDQAWLGYRVAQWQELKRLCDDWNNCCPRTMHPFGYVKPSMPKARSAFPRIWMIQREATIGRLLYHAVECILSHAHPVESVASSERMHALRLHHAHQVCGIVAHTTDRSVAIVAIRCLAITATVLTESSEQAEVLDMLDRINATSGWRLGAVEMELKKAWGWERMKLPVPTFKNNNHGQARSTASLRRASVPLMPARVSTPPPAMAAVGPKTPVNPLSFADFKLPNHPYQNWYEPPNKPGSFNPPSL